MVKQHSPSVQRNFELELPFEACDKAIERVFTELGATHLYRMREAGPRAHYKGLLSLEAQTLEVAVMPLAPERSKVECVSVSMRSAPAEVGSQALDEFERALKRQAGVKVAVA